MGRVRAGKKPPVVVVMIDRTQSTIALHCTTSPFLLCGALSSLDSDVQCIHLTVHCSAFLGQCSEGWVGLASSGRQRGGETGTRVSLTMMLGMLLVIYIIITIIVIITTIIVSG